MDKRDQDYKRLFWVLILCMGIPSLLWTGLNAYHQYTLWDKARELYTRTEKVKDTQRQLDRTIKALTLEIRKEANKKHGRQKER